MNASKSPQNVSFIRVSHPEIFKIKPRPGGAVPIEENVDAAIKKTNDIDFTIKETVSKEFRVQTALDETESFDSEDATATSPFKDAMYMFGVSISTLMMMANDEKNIPDEYLDWTMHCLQCVKDDFGNHPPNVQGILNYIKKLKPKDKSVVPAPENKEDPEQTIRTTTTVKMPDSN